MLISSLRERNARTLDALQQILGRAELAQRRAHHAHGLVRRLPAAGMRREDHRVLALDRVDRDADRRHVRAGHRNQRGDDAGRLRVLDDALLGDLLDDARCSSGAARRAGCRAPSRGASAPGCPCRSRRRSSSRAGSRSSRCRRPRRPRGTADRPPPGRSASTARIAALARASSVVRDRLFLGRDAFVRVRSRLPWSTVRSRAAARRRRSTGILIRIGFSRVCSSSTSALSPATRPTMNRSLPTMDGKPRSTRIGGERAVDVQRDRLDALADRRFERAREADAVAREAGVLREPEQHGDARIDRRVHAMSETGQPRLRRLSPRRPVRAATASSGRPSGARAVEARRDQLHAARAGAAVLVADREDAGGDRGGQRLAVARRGEPRRRARRRAGAVIGDADQDRVEQPAFARRRQPLVMQQEDEIGERRLLHQRRGRRVRGLGCGQGRRRRSRCAMCPFKWLDITSVQVA